MGNYRGMMAGLGEAMSTVGKMGLADSIDQQKEARLEKIRQASELRSEERALASEGRAEDRAVAAEGRAAAQAAKDRIADHELRLQELGYKSKLDRAEAAEKARLEKEVEALKSRYKVITTDGTFDQPGGVFIYNENNPNDISKVDPSSNQVIPVGSRTEPAKPAIPAEVQALARKMAERDVDSRTSMLGLDSTELADVGGDRETAISVFTNRNLAGALRAYNYNPSDYGVSGGLISDVNNAPPAPTGNKVPPAQSVDSSPIPGVPAAIYSDAKRKLESKGLQATPETIRRYIEYYSQKGQSNGGVQR